MKRLKNILGIVAALFIAQPIYAQVVPGAAGYYNDALLFSNTQYGASARVLGIGGAQMSLGGDISNISGNPAGLGFIRRSEISFSPSFSGFGSDSNYLGFNDSDNASNFNIGNLGLVISNVKDPLQLGKWRGGSFGIGYSRMRNFRNNQRYVGENGVSSIIDSFVEQGSGISPSEIGGFGLAGAAYNSYLIDPDPNFPNEYIPFTLAPPFQSELIETRGRIDDINFSYGGNYDNKVFFGASIGISSLNYSINNQFSESFDDPAISGFNIDETLAINGTGVNATVGVIVKPIHWLNLGATIKTPTTYRLSEESFGRIDAFYNNFEYQFINEDGDLESIFLNDEFGETPVFVSDYRITTPMRINTSATLFAGKFGFVSADVEFVDYTRMRINSRDFSPREDNQTIRNIYQNTINYRLGGEFRYDMFRLRAGYNIQGDPYADSDYDRSVQAISFGAGLKFQNYYVDFAFVNTKFNTLYSPYSTSFDTPVAEFENRINSGILTVGFNF
ncbi:OmpP1/FadL family transporter [Penaeicola halotolerans]|uniref:OmpP1/FadL family transporter n=1 Tax=Penaeicola halotolerans TaxID=2793196 RepID=UPI001CF7F7ED|nr:long-chain fatty acid transporter [Penaeicola halotolerans]